MAWIYLKEPMDLWTVSGSIIVIIGCLMVTIPPLLVSSSDVLYDLSMSTQVDTSPDPAIESLMRQHCIGERAETESSEYDDESYEPVSTMSFHPMWIMWFAVSVMPNAFCAVVQVETETRVL